MYAYFRVYIREYVCTYEYTHAYIYTYTRIHFHKHIHDKWNMQIYAFFNIYIHPPRLANCTLFVWRFSFYSEVLFLFSSLSTDPKTLLCKRQIQEFHRAQIVKFVSFTGAFTSKYIVKSVKEACETVHSTPKETCQYATQFDRPYETACFSCICQDVFMYV